MTASIFMKNTQKYPKTKPFPKAPYPKARTPNLKLPRQRKPNLFFDRGEEKKGERPAKLGYQKTFINKEKLNQSTGFISAF